MSLYNLPDIKFVDDDPKKTENNVIQLYEALTDRKLFPGDPVRLFLLSLAQIIVQQRVLINQTGRQNSLRYATGDYLDHKGADSRTERLEAISAKTTVRFELSAVRPSVVAINQGTRVCPTDKKVYFSTVEYAEIAPGQTHVDILCSCLEPGMYGNGFLPGQIDTIVDPIGFIQKVSNMTESTGGADRESDDAYRERIYNAPEAFSVAGPEGAYQYWAKTASPLITDVAVDSPAAGEIKIIPLLTGGEIPTADLLNAVADICNARNIRPLTDHVTVVTPTTQDYTVNFTYWISRDRATEAAAIQAAVQQATDQYVLWQKSKLGRDRNPSELIRRVMAAGAYRVDVVSPSFAAVAWEEIAVASNVTVTFGGLVDD